MKKMFKNSNLPDFVDQCILFLRISTLSKSANSLNKIFFLISALDTTNVQIKKQVFELLSALCVYSSEGYNRALEALEHYKSFRSERYRFKLIVDELRGAKATEYQTTLLAFVNCLIISTPQLKVGTDPLLLPVIRSQKQPNPALLCNWQKKTNVD